MNPQLKVLPAALVLLAAATYAAAADLVLRYDRPANSGTRAGW